MPICENSYPQKQSYNWGAIVEILLSPLPLVVRVTLCLDWQSH